MKKTIMLNGHRYTFGFKLFEGKAIEGHFCGGGTSELITDLIAVYGKEAKLHDIVLSISASIKQYQVTINETVCRDVVYEVYGIDEDDAKDEAMTGNGELIMEHEIDTDFHVVNCQVVEDE